MSDCRSTVRATDVLPKRTPAKGSIRSAKVLIVDDDRALRDALRRALGLAGYDITLAAEDGQEALAQAAAAAPDAMVLDVGLPGIDGGFCVLYVALLVVTTLRLH